MNILFADFHGINRLGISTLLSSKYENVTFSECFTHQELVAKITNQSIDIVIIDPTSFDDFDFSDVVMTRVQGKKTAYFIFASVLDNDMMLKAIDNNVDAFLSKECDVSEFEKAIEFILIGKKYYCPELTEFLFQLRTREKQSEVVSSKKSILTAKEEEIVRLIGEGLSAKEVADRLFISVHTSNTHRKNIYRKCGVRNTSELVMFALKTGIIERIEYYI